MKKKTIFIISIILLIISSLVVYLKGQEATFNINIKDFENVFIICENKIIKCNYKIENNNIHFKIKPIKSGKSTIIVKENSINKNTKNKQIKTYVYVHKSKVITLDSFLGRCNGDVSFIISFYIIILLILIHLIVEYRKSIKRTLYSYRNVRRLGLIIFIMVTTMFHLFFYIYDLSYGSHTSINSFISTLNKNTYLFLIMIFPIAIILTILVSISNLRLLQKEGKRWKNMLGIILGGFINIAFIIVILFDSSFNNNFYFMIICNIFTMCITYLECVFIGTCILAIKSARHIPEFNKDAILILGCQIKRDGTLTNLLKSRVDRAIKFSKMQKEFAKKDIIFIPSGGQGSDEVISEAKAMENYLLDKGIKKENILIEDKSTNTYENIKFSNNLIKKKIKNPKLAFSTTNYHVFRAGIIANDQNIDMEGIGASTKTYYWINAFIREFVATLVSEKKSNIKILFILSIIVVFFTVMISLSYNF